MSKLRNMLTHVVWLSGRIACVVRWEWWSESVVRIGPVTMNRNSQWVVKNSWEE